MMSANQQSVDIKKAERGTITIAAVLVQDQECVDYFGKDIIELGYYPIHLKIDNRTPDTYILRPSYISVPLATPRKVAQQLHYDTSLIITTACYPALLFFWQLIPCAIVPAGIYMREQNKKVTRTIQKKALSTQEILEIAPYTTIERFIFVHAQDYIPHIDISLFNDRTKELATFNIDQYSQA